LKNWDSNFDNRYAEIYVDSFEVEDISFIKSKKQKHILDKLSKYKTIQTAKITQTNPKIIKPLNEVFGNIDELKTALRITRKLLEDGFDVMEQGSLMHLCYELFGKRIKDNKITSVDEEKLYNLTYKVSIGAYNHDKTRK